MSKENEPPSHQGQEGQQAKDEPKFYYQASRFPGEQSAGWAYKRAQDAIFQTECDLSVYRLRIKDVYHVVALGQTPPSTVDLRLRTILSAGTPAEIPPETLSYLIERRIQSARQAPWVERHFRPGQDLDPSQPK